jgi:hypothetical protein
VRRHDLTVADRRIGAVPAGAGENISQMCEIPAYRYNPWTKQ